MTSWRDVPKPPQIAALPIDERTGFPILFTVQPPEGREANFRLILVLPSSSTSVLPWPFYGLRLCQSSSSGSERLLKLVYVSRC